VALEAGASPSLPSGVPDPGPAQPDTVGRAGPVLVPDESFPTAAARRPPDRGPSAPWAQHSGPVPLARSVRGRHRPVPPRPAVL